MTGGLGFIGSHVAAALASWDEIVVLDDLSTGLDDNRRHLPGHATVVKGDVRAPDASLFADADAVFHLAAQTAIGRSMEDAPFDADVNVLGTLRVLEACRRHDVGAFVFSGSNSIFGVVDARPVPVDHRTTPVHPYGVAKLAADHYVRLYAELYGLPTVRLRYANVYGPRQSATSAYSGVVARFVANAVAGAPLVVHGSGRQERDFVHVSDVVRANLLAAKKARTVSGRVYAVGTGKGTTILGLAELVASFRPGTTVVHGPARAGDPMTGIPDVAGARADLWFEASTSLESGIRDLVERSGGST